MGNDLDKKFIDLDNDRKEKEKHNFENIRNGLENSTNNINNALKSIKDWDELMALKIESDEENDQEEEKSFKDQCLNNIFIFIIFGILFCFINLIGVQASIIILNSLFNEIVEEFKLWINGTPRKFNFYQIIEINTYRDLPEIDVAMITSSIGIIFLKNFGFYCSIITLQLISSVSFFLLFLLFEFHKNDQLLENYTRLEIVVLVLAYILLSFIVGCSSTISLKEYFNIDRRVFEKKKEFSEKGQMIVFYFFSGISLMITMIINRKIFKSFKSKWILLSIAILCFASFLISVIFHILFLIPVNVKKKNIQKEIENQNNIEIRDFENNRKIPFQIGSNNTRPQTENTRLKAASTARANNNDDPTKNNYFTKICTFCGYIYFQKDTKNSEGKKKICICYYYSDKCTWFKETILKFDVYAPFLTELYCQICIIGYKLILTEKLLENYTYIKNMKYFIVLFIISVILASVFIPDDDFGTQNQKNNDNNNNNNNENLTNSKKSKISICFSFDNENVLITVQVILFAFTIFILISSVCYYEEMKITKKRWDYVYMVGYGVFKTIDLIILSFYDFFDNSDIFNTTLAITFEKLLWMIIEAIIYSLDISKKTLVVVQLICSSIAIVILIVIGCSKFCSLCCNNNK